jgi:polyphosphate kinase
VLTGYSRQTSYRSLLVAPEHLRTGIIERIEAETAAAKQGRPAGIRIKANSLVDEVVIDALYRASRAGVQIDCLIRGICALRAGVPALSETVRVRSVLGRFLEHSRIYQFQASGEYWIGSADMMHRNLDRRVETLVRVRAPELQQQLSDVLDLAFSDEIRAWELLPDNTWRRRNGGLLDYQAELARRAAARTDGG